MSLRLRRLGALILLVALSACESVRPPFVTLAPSASPVAGTATPAQQPSSRGASPEASPPPSAPGTSSTTQSAASSATTPPSGAASPANAGSPIATFETLAQNPMPARDSVALAYQYGRTQDQQRIVREQPREVQVGDVKSFWLSNVDDNSRYQIEAELRLALDHTLVYIETGVDVDFQVVERDARIFNDQIYPRTRELFGSEWSPGIDGDPRLTILIAQLSPGLAGYFSSSDEVPRAVNRYSNEREMFYVSVGTYQFDDSSALGTLAHEFQHMIQHNEATGAHSTWLNEGLAQLAEELNDLRGGGDGFSSAYLADPDVQLTTWASLGSSAPHYGAAYLFSSYYYEQYGAQAGVRGLLSSGAAENLELFTELVRAQNPQIDDFGDLYADWAITNLLNDASVGEGRYAHAQLSTTVEPQALDLPLDETVAQFGSDYWNVGPSRQERVLRFDGSDTIGVVSAEPQGTAMWWSNRGDDGASTLDRRIDLRDAAQATLSYRLWYDIEAGWDYGYVAVSADGGQTWTTLAGRYTTTDDPQGQSQGNGYTGVSGGGDIPQWVDESIDLSAYAGSEIMLRFALISDDATNRPGMVIDDLRIPELSFSDDAESDDGGWIARGFTRTDNRLPQQWELRFVRRAGDTVTVEPIALDGDNRAELRVAAGESGTLIVMATTPYTTERATYRIGN